MSIVYVSTKDKEFFVTSDSNQGIREGQNISGNFVPHTNFARTNQDTRESLTANGFTEIPNPDPAFEPVKLAGLLAEGVR